MGFSCMSDEFRHGGAVLVRHLLQIRLTECSPVAQPGYLTTSAAVRSLARQVGEDPEDVQQLANQGELRSLFTRTDNIQSAPTPLEVAQRSHVAPAPELVEARSGELDIRRRQLELQRIKPAVDSGEPCYDHGSTDIKRRQLELRRRKMEWDSAETRSLPDDFPTDRNGHAIHSHPTG